MLSVFIFLIPDAIFPESSEFSFSVFIASYLISVIYFGILWFKKIHNFYGFHANMEYGFLHLVLCLISAYALNREIPIFEQSTMWMQVLLVIQSIAFISLFFQKIFPLWLTTFLFVILGIGFAFFIYLAIYLIPVYPVGIIGFFVLGITLHAFVPLLISGSILLFLLRNDNRKRRNILGFAAGVFIALLVVATFVIQWKNTNSIITKASDRSLLDEKNDLPEWTVIARNLPKNSFSEKILKSGIVYSAVSEENIWRLFDLPSRSFDEVRKHDPLIMIATFFNGRPKLNADDRIKVLKAMYDSRHYAQERLWSGENLKTSHVLTNIRIFPNLHIGYTEKIISVRNDEMKQSWNRSQEAIYTFHMPEGAVVTSLSLWINGKEEKAILTSKNKADSAYRTIVGYESRDPSLVRWHEGNTVSVRIFPCTPNEDRRFKIGITAPLTQKAKVMEYENIWFDGPGCGKADESIKLVLMDDVNNLTLPSGFEKLTSNSFFYDGKYNAGWACSMESQIIRDNNFSFDGNSYKIEPYKKSYSAFELKNLYLDINKSWDNNDLKKVMSLAGNNNVFVYTDKLVKVTPQNLNEVSEDLRKLNFSVFPLYEIKFPANSLLITKGSFSSPNLSDLSESSFSLKLQEYLLAAYKIKLYNLGNELSPFIKTLKELRAIEYDGGDINYLSELISDKKFISNQENSNTVVISNAAIKITETSDTAVSNAPDHLMRLYSYNNVMFRTGINYLKEGYYDSTIVNKAYKAYVVSPVTSLVVLESQQDYKRFGITDEGVSLKNASMKSSGAVPEPHEWLLITVLAGLCIFLYLKNKKVSQILK